MNKATEAIDQHARPACSRLEKFLVVNAGVKNGYTLAVMPSLRCTCLVAIGVLVAVFVALYPLLDCGPGGCPEASHAAHAGLSTACLAALLAGSSAAAPIFFSFLGQHGITNSRRPIETYLSPEAPPPRVLPGR